VELGNLLVPPLPLELEDNAAIPQRLRESSDGRDGLGAPRRKFPRLKIVTDTPDYVGGVAGVAAVQHAPHLFVVASEGVGLVNNERRTILRDVTVDSG